MTCFCGFFPFPDLLLSSPFKKLLQPHVPVCAQDAQPRQTCSCLGLTLQGPRSQPPPAACLSQAFSPGRLPRASPQPCRPPPAPPSAPALLTLLALSLSLGCCPRHFGSQHNKGSGSPRILVAHITSERSGNRESSLAWEVFGISRGLVPRAQAVALARQRPRRWPWTWHLPCPPPTV